MTSLEIARQLEGDPDVRVKGILMIDSAYPAMLAHRKQQMVREAGGGQEGELGDPQALAQEEVGKSKNQVLSIRAMREARKMIARWELPRWEGELRGRRPPAILIRARDSLYSEDWTSAIDASRGVRTLGWDAYDEGMFVDVLEVDGHHFNMFDHSRIPGITAAISKALTKLDPPTKDDSVDEWDMGHPPF
ncbi:hypothetical protein NLG97_g11185 [Lecanicillium saksenae]|uniref:Uncharacterized protein n=1 Tax=Lecanicillium saksenae TaxID=468837 RepID=A0ACC1QB40_9HYPO|nr:hypothetical protein NLG97_g11185 [Lecanicillium saksenae]